MCSYRHPHVRIEAHKVYNEYIQHKQHIHMNSTKWLTLTEYVMYLGREGFCKVEDTPKGWFISVIHRDLEQVCCTYVWSVLASCDVSADPLTSRESVVSRFVL